MATVASPFGLLPRWHPSGQTRSNAYDNVLLSGMTTPIYQGTPVKLVIGAGAAISGVTVPVGQMVIAPVAATTDAFLGVFDGVEYVDSNGRAQYSKQWPAGLALSTGTIPRVWIFDDPANIYEIQFDGALNTGTNAYNFYGKQAVFNSTDISATAPAGNSITGMSACRASATLTATGSQGQLRIVNLPGQPINTIQDAFPTEYVQIARHQFANPQTSL
jgi:hypothetical protein